MTERVLYPSVRYHPEFRARIVHDADESDVLQAEDNAWRDTPYPPPVVIPPPPEPTVAELKAANTGLLEQIAALAEENDKLAADRDALAAELPKMSKELDKLRAALAKKQPKIETEGRLATAADLERQPV